MSKKLIVLNRLKGSRTQTIGRAILLDQDYNELFNFVTLELGWLGNLVDKSCIAPEKYTVVVRYSDKYGRHLHVKDVLGRTVVLIHWGNFYYDTEGCILVGKDYKFINNDDFIDISSSKRTFNKLMNLIDDKDEITLVITPTILEL